MADFLRAYAFVDGHNFRKACRDLNHTELIDFHVEATRQCGNMKWLGSRVALARVLYYDVEPDPSNSAEKAYREALAVKPDLHLRYGYLRASPKKLSKLTQKGVDILLAIDMLEAASKETMDIALLFAGDGDFVPLVEAVVRLGPRVVVVAPEKSLASELEQVAD